MLMKIVTIVVVAVLVVGGSVFLLTGTEWGGRVLDREEVIEGVLREIEMDREELEEILGRIEGRDYLSYDVIIDSPEISMEGTFWQKGSKIRVEGDLRDLVEEMEVEDIEIDKVVVILDIEERVVYTYVPAQNMAMKRSLEDAEGIKESSIKEQAEDLLEKYPVVIGLQTIRGKECVVVEYLDEETPGKMWIWREHGLPIKAEVGETVVEAVNIDFGEFSDDKFQLPPGVQIFEVPTGIPTDFPVDDFDIEDFDIEGLDIQDFDIDQFDIQF